MRLWKKVLIAIAAIFTLLILYAALIAPKEFQIERSVEIQASPEKIFPHLNDLRAFNEWNPWAKLDPNSKITFSTVAAGLGATSRWEGDGNVGVGTMTITESIPGSHVHMRLDFEKPFAGTNEVKFMIRPSDKDTKESRVTWSMEGKNTFLPRLFCTLTFTNMDKMMGTTFEKGLDALKTTVESGKK